MYRLKIADDVTVCTTAKIANQLVRGSPLLLNDHQINHIKMAIVALSIKASVTKSLSSLRTISWFLSGSLAYVTKAPKKYARTGDLNGMRNQPMPTWNAKFLK